MRKEIFEEDNFYHIYNRGSDKRLIFMDDRDRLRFINTVYVMNNFSLTDGHFDFVKLEPRDALVPLARPYVGVLASTLMPNHYHFMFCPKRKGGLSQFLHKLGTSYTKYFNKRHERTGRLFESTFKAKHVDSHECASYLTQYIHLNPAELFKAPNADELLKKLNGYLWSSLPDYLGKKSRLSHILSSNFRKEILDMDETDYLDMVKEAIEDFLISKRKILKIP